MMGGKRSMLLRELSDDKDENLGVPSTSSATPWKEEFGKYYDAVDTLPEGMSVVEWWGVSIYFYWNIAVW
jgi:hypothetical protein